MMAKGDDEMAQAPELDFQGFVAKKQRQEPGGGKPGPAPDPAHAYAYSFDRKTREVLERLKPVELAVAGTVRLFKDVASSQLLGHAVKVGEKQFPRIQTIARECTKTLGIETP